MTTVRSRGWNPLGQSPRERRKININNIVPLIADVTLSCDKMLILNGASLGGYSSFTFTPNAALNALYPAFVQQPVGSSALAGFYNYFVTKKVTYKMRWMGPIVYPNQEGVIDSASNDISCGFTFLPQGVAFADLAVFSFLKDDPLTSWHSFNGPGQAWEVTRVWDAKDWLNVSDYQDLILDQSLWVTDALSAVPAEIYQTAVWAVPSFGNTSNAVYIQMDMQLELLAFHRTGLPLGGQVDLVPMTPRPVYTWADGNLDQADPTADQHAKIEDNTDWADITPP